MKSMAELKAKPRKTVDDLLALPPETRAELIEGEITVMTASPFRPHQSALNSINVAIWNHLAARGGGSVFIAPLDVHLPTGDVVEPDLIFLAAANPARTEDWIRGVPDLLVEALSVHSHDRDRFVKKALYERNGVPEYWIVDPEERTIEVFRLRDGRYEPSGYLREGDRLATPLLTGLSIEVAGIFARS